jgi:prephenate dehydrogenase
MRFKRRVTTRFQRVAVIGVGLIGGSFALALKRAGACGHVVGAGRSAATLREAKRLGIIDSVAASPAAAAQDADLILVATPVSHFKSVFSRIKIHLKDGAIVTDGGSTKRDVIAAARKGLGAKVRQFVPAHPIAGAERSGPRAARADLFQGRRVVVTPLRENKKSDLKKVIHAWQACGARVSSMDARRHDAVLAAVSHLPHLLAYALVHEVAGRANSKELFSFAAGGFRDFTRIASSHPEMWRDISVANRDRLLEELQRFSKKLRQVGKLLGKPKRLEKLFAEARDARDQWIRSS